MRTIRSIIMLFAALPLAVTAAAAQEPAGGVPTPQPVRVALAASAGVAFPVGRFADLVNTGSEVAARGEYQASPALAVYLGFRYASFPLQDALATGNVHVAAPEAGIVVRPQRRSGVVPWARLGAFVPRVSSEGTHESAGLGIGGSVGAEVAVGGGFSIAADFDGEYCGNGIRKIPHVGPGPHPGWGGVSLQAKLAF